MLQIPKATSSNFLTRRYPGCAGRLAIGCEVVFRSDLASVSPGASLVSSYRVTGTNTAIAGITVYALTEIGGLSRTVLGVPAGFLHVVSMFPSVGTMRWSAPPSLASFDLDLAA